MARMRNRNLEIWIADASGDPFRTSGPIPIVLGDCGKLLKEMPKIIPSQNQFKNNLKHSYLHRC